MLVVRVLGGLALEHAGEPLEPPGSRRARELLALLAVTPGRCSRGLLAARMWPDVPEAGARTGLRGALAELRRGLGPHAAVVQAGRDDVGLDPAAVRVDLRGFRAAADAGRWAEALAWDRGTLLPGLEAEWAEEVRAEHARSLLRVLAEAAAGHEAAGRLREAAELAARRVRADPLSEQAGRELVRLLAAAGDRAAALDAGRALAERLQRELGVPPDRETAALLDGLRRARAAPAGDDAVSGPTAPALGDLAPAEFVGRDGPLAAVRAARRAPLPAMVLVRGEAGIGKTALAAVTAREAVAEGWTVLHGRCDEESIVPYCAWVEALGPVVDGLDDRAAARVVDDGGGGLVRLFPRLRRGRQGPEVTEDADTERWRLFEAVARLLAGLAARAPVLLVLEDVHWADRSTLLLLRHVLRTSQETACAVLVTARPEEAGEEALLPALLTQERRERRLTEVDLAGLSETDVGRLARRHRGGSDWSRFVRALHAETEGNPFFVREILRNLPTTPDSAPLPPAGGFDVPDGVRELLQRRLRRLDPVAQDVLTLASVVGRDVDLGTLEAVGTWAPDHLVDALDAATASGLLTEQGIGRWSFPHALVRSALSDGLSRTRRARLHARVADALERRGAAGAAEIAHHLLGAGDPASVDRAVGYARQAAAEAVAQAAYAEAAAVLRRTVDAVTAVLGADPHRLGPLLLELGEALSRAADTAAARQTFTEAAGAARAVGDPAWLGTAALGLAGPSWQGFGTVDAEVIGLLEDALAVVPPDRPALRARLQARLAVALSFARRPERVQELTAAALDAARGLGEGPVLAAALEARLWATWHPYGVAERLALADELLDVARREDAPETAAVARRWRVVALLEAGRIEEVWPETARHAEEAGRLRMPYELMYVAVFTTMRALLEGRLADAQASAEHVRTFAELRGGADAVQFGGVHALTLASLAGGLAAMADPLLGFARAYPALPAWGGAAAYALAVAGRTDEAQAEVDALWPPEERLPVDAVLLPGLVFLAMAVTALGDRERAAHLYRLLEPLAGRTVVLGAGGAVWGTTDARLAELAETAGRPGAAAAHRAAARAALRALGADPELFARSAHAVPTVH
ncbi:ATP-binding protein [Geodermatophilus nigrescens]|uniref:Transcriptional activator domain-containing protein n=1 Tax=Geodermatophilus nigrescens TaxID=1070870 RepID=A0A1M5S4L7_9ACTN|nr:AAA family ATPase [Geodermatophilus nigrescens]SHH33426.1 transcriptional activator domain-containing protein [Geodermatophilus nigrescens]